MRFLALPRGDWRHVLGGAVLLCLAYPPFHLFVPSFLALVPAVWLIADAQADLRPVRRQLVQGFWFGLCGNGLILYWIIFALWHFTPLAGLGFAATVIILALYQAAVFGLTGWVSRRTGLGLAVTFPIFWTVAEWAIGHQGDIRFPWLGLGTSLTGYPTVVQIAELVGARGITYLLALASTALALAWLGRRERRRALWYATAVVLGLVAATAYGVVRERTIVMRPVGTVAVLQPNVAYSEKWEPGRRDSIMLDALNLAARAIHETTPDLVAWPEAAVPGYFHQHPTWHRAIAQLSRAALVPQLVGGLDVVFGPGDAYEYYNAAFLFDSLGRSDAQPVYHKQYLVPITERVPFLNPRWFDLPFFGGFGIGRERPLYEIDVGRFGVFICYESAFEDLARSYRARGADFLLNITNDAWFGRTSAPYQHAAHLVMRAIENRVGIARSANTGISEYVDPLGREHRRTVLYTRTLMADTVLTSDVRTLYARWGDWVGVLSLVLGGVLVAFALVRRR